MSKSGGGIRPQGPDGVGRSRFNKLPSRCQRGRETAKLSLPHSCPTRLPRSTAGSPDLRSPAGASAAAGARAEPSRAGERAGAERAGAEPAWRERRASAEAEAAVAVALRTWDQPAAQPATHAASARGSCAASSAVRGWSQAASSPRKSVAQGRGALHFMAAGLVNLV